MVMFIIIQILLEFIGIGLGLLGFMLFLKVWMHFNKEDEYTESFLKGLLEIKNKVIIVTVVISVITIIMILNNL